MKKNLILSALVVLSFSASSFADQAANWTCKGDGVTFTESTPYMGEDSPHTQTLHTITDSVSTAYFLVSSTKSNANASVIQGSNGKGGRFSLVLSNIQPRDGSESPSIDDVATGSLSYQHGAMNGKNVSMNCERQ